MTLRTQIIKKNGLTYYFSTRVRPNSCKQLEGNIVVHTLESTSPDGRPITCTHHDSILATDENADLRWWGIYSIENHKVDYDPPEYDPMRNI